MATSIKDLAVTSLTRSEPSREEGNNERQKFRERRGSSPDAARCRCGAAAVRNPRDARPMPREFSYKLATGQDPTHPVNKRSQEAIDRIREATGGKLEIPPLPGQSARIGHRSAGPGAQRRGGVLQRGLLHPGNARFRPRTR